MLKYSIIIPTCNKELIKMCLEYISNLNKPKEEYEVLVIHNVSTDNIKQTVNEFQTKIPNLQYFYEEKYGQMSSRHLGAKNAKGEILCYLDDDSCVDKNWLIAIEKTFNNPDVVLAGGNNLPLYEVPPVKWLKYFWVKCPYGESLSELSLINFYNRNMKLPAWYTFGCNFIIRKNIFFELGGTHPDVVPNDKQRFQGDGETALSIKLNKEKYVSHFSPDIKIHHYVPKGRMTIEYFKKRGFYQGVCDSFSKIRKEHGFDYDFIPNTNIDTIHSDITYLIKFVMLIKKIIKRILRMIDNRNYHLFLKVKAEYNESHNEGFTFHQVEVKNDPELLKWVLKENYLND